MSSALSAEVPLAGPTSRLRRLQITFTGFCMMSIAFNYMDRATLSIATLDIRHEFGLSATAIGALISLWSLCYAFGQLPSGFLVDRFGPRIMAGLGLLVWSVFQGLGGICASFTQLLWARGGLGVAESPTGPSNAKVVSTWFPPHKRGVPTGFYVGGTALGPAIAPPILTALLLAWGWRMMFIIMGGVGVVLSLAWFLFYRRPETARLTPEERVYVRGNEQVVRVELELAGKSTITLGRWVRLFGCATVIGIVLANFAQGFVGWIYAGWLPAMLEMQYHVSIQRTGILAALPWVGGLVGALSAGIILDYALAKGFGPIVSKKVMMIGGLVGLSVFTALAGLSATVAPVVIFVFLALLSNATVTAAMWTGATIFVPRHYVASMGAIMNFSSFLGATVSPVLTGYTVDRTGLFELALLIGAGVGIAGAIAVVLLIRHPVTAADLGDPSAA